MQTSALERGDMFCENREKMGGVCNWVVVSNMLYFHPYLRKISNLSNGLKPPPGNYFEEFAIASALNWVAVME